VLASCPVKQFIRASLNKVSPSYRLSFNDAKKAIKSSASAQSAEQCLPFSKRSSFQNQKALHFFTRLCPAIPVSMSCWFLCLTCQRNDSFITDKIPLFIRNSVLLL
jgi:hypothetical protein